MSVQLAESERKVLQLPPVLDLQAVPDLAREISSNQHVDLTIQAGGVERIGALCAQLFVSASKTWQRNGRDFHIEAPTTEFLDGISGLGLSEALTLNEEG